MIVQISISVPDLTSLSRQDASYLFSELLRSSRQGFHRVVIPRALARWIADNVELSKIDHAHLVRLRGEYAQLAGLISRATILVRVVVGNDLEVAESGRVVEIGHERLLSGRFLERTVLLLENAANDGRMLSKILSHEARRISFGEVSYVVANGGGTGTATELKRFIDDQNIVVCVCDSDVFVPGGRRSQTCNAVITQGSKVTFAGVVSSTPGREIENFLSIDVIESLYSVTMSAECAALRSLFENQAGDNIDECVWLYLDLKSGLPSGKLLSECNTPQKRSWAVAKFSVDESELGSIVIFGLGDNIINDFFNNDVAQSLFFKFTRSSYWATHFSEWVENILWGTCGRKELRTG